MTHFIQGDARHLPLADNSVHCCATSPPYWGLRDYGVVGQIGLEPTLAEYLAVMVGVFREVRRVLRPDGTLWINMGDGYSNDTKWGGTSGGKNYTSAAGGYQGQRVRRGTDCDPKRGSAAPGQPMGRKVGFKAKDLLMQPHRLAIALQEDGWYVRMDNVWAKPNPMPESVTDRPTKAHEYVFLLSKSARYFYDAEAVREAARDWGTRDRKTFRGGTTDPLLKHHGFKDANSAAGGRNLRSVWTMTTRPCKEAHFATFPIDLPLRCIRAGTSERGCCPTCGAPWRRVVEKVRTFESGSGRSGNMPVGKNGSDLQGGGETLDVRRGPTVSTLTTCWLPTCKCPAHTPIPCTVLDPFGGAATTALAAHELGRNCIIVERKFEYLELGRRRLANHRPRAVKRAPKVRPVQCEAMLFAETGSP